MISLIGIKNAAVEKKNQGSAKVLRNACVALKKVFLRMFLSSMIVNIVAKTFVLLFDFAFQTRGTVHNQCQVNFIVATYHKNL